MSLYDFYQSLIGEVGLNDPVYLIFVLSTALLILETFFKSLFSAVFTAFKK